MDLFQVNVAVGDREIECTVKKGILATIETGTHVDKVETPTNRISVMVGDGRGEPSAWVQVADYDGQHFQLSSEGWVDESGECRSMPNPIASVSARMQRVTENQVVS